MQSLDACNRYLEGFSGLLEAFLPKLDALKARLTDRGFQLVGDEPMKLTLRSAAYGYSGNALARILAEHGVTSEFHDPDFLVLMPTPQNADGELERLGAILGAVPRRAPLADAAPPYRIPRAAMSIRAATFAPKEALPLEECEGRVLAAPAVSCPPCVPIAVCGEMIDGDVIRRLKYYGITMCEVVKGRGCT